MPVTREVMHVVEADFADERYRCDAERGVSLDKFGCSRLNLADGIAPPAIHDAVETGQTAERRNDCISPRRIAGRNRGGSQHRPEQARQVTGGGRTDGQCFAIGIQLDRLVEPRRIFPLECDAARPFEVPA